MANTRDIKKRINSISNTKKITRAMEMVSGAKMRKAIEAVLRTRTYANLSWATVLNLAQTFKGKGGQDIHPLLIKRNEIKKVAIVLITSNRGLCGGFNSAIIKKAVELIKNITPSSSPSHPNDARQNDLVGLAVGQVSGGEAGIIPPDKGGAGGLNSVSYEFILLGKKGAAVYKNFGFEVAADFPKLDYINEVREVVPTAQMIIKDYLAGKYDKVMVAYTDFVNAVKQIPTVKQLLPIDITAADEYLGGAREWAKPAVEQGLAAGKGIDGQSNYEYIFEPSPEEVLNEMLPRLIEIQLYQAMLESNASEQSARRFAMHQATEAASDMVGELTLSYNKARQAGVTSEIAEISAGANALAE